MKRLVCALFTLLALSSATAEPGVGSTRSVFTSGFCARERCRLVGLNDQRDSFGFGHNCGVDFDFYHYRLRGQYGLYEYRVPEPGDQGDAQGRPKYNPRKNKVVGFQLEGVRWPDSPDDPEAQLVSRLVEYATGIRAPFNIEKPYRAWQRMNAALHRENVQFWPVVSLPIRGGYALSVDFGQGFFDATTGEVQSLGPRVSIFVGVNGFPC